MCTCHKVIMYKSNEFTVIKARSKITIHGAAAHAMETGVIHCMNYKKKLCAALNYFQVSLVILLLRVYVLLVLYPRNILAKG